MTAIPRIARLYVSLDAGANIDCKPIHLVQFAVMGEVYARVACGVSSPRVGVLSNGEEDSKGTDATRVAHDILKNCRCATLGMLRVVT